MNKKIYNIWFSSLDIENQTKLTLLKNYEAEEIWNFELNDFEKNNINQTDIEKILRAKNLDYAKMADRIMEKNKIEILSIKNEKYPQKLHHIQDKPAFIYVRGNSDILDDDAVRNSWL